MHHTRKVVPSDTPGVGRNDQGTGPKVKNTIDVPISTKGTGGKRVRQAHKPKAEFGKTRRTELLRSPLVQLPLCK